MFDDKLSIRKEMKTSYLIQRLHKPSHFMVAGKKMDNPFSFGGGLRNGGLNEEAMSLLRNILSFDYMGSAEFEWGAVPEALHFIAKQITKKNVVTGNVDDVWFLCPSEYEKEVRNRISALRQDEYCWHKKEFCGLRDYFESDSEYAKRNVGWLELNNGYAFFVDMEMFEQFCQLFGISVDVA